MLHFYLCSVNARLENDYSVQFLSVTIIVLGREMDSLMFKRSWVRIPAPDTGWTFFIVVKIVMIARKIPKINEKEAENGPLKATIIVKKNNSTLSQTKSLKVLYAFYCLLHGWIEEHSFVFWNPSKKVDKKWLTGDGDWKGSDESTLGPLSARNSLLIKRSLIRKFLPKWHKRITYQNAFHEHCCFVFLYKNGPILASFLFIYVPFKHQSNFTT